MPPPTPLAVGGLVLKRADIQSILDEPGTVGIAFACSAPGNSPNVDIKVVKVFLDPNNNYQGEEIPISLNNKKGAIGPFEYPVGSFEAYNYQYLQKLQDDLYGFGYFELFDGLFQGRDDWDELFIGGGKQTFPDGLYDQTDWFSFAISMRKGIPEYDLPDEPLFEPTLGSNFPGYQIVRLPVIKPSGVISTAELRGADPALAALETLEVDGVLKITARREVKGILFKGGVAAVFPSAMPVRSFRMNYENYELDKITLVNNTLESLDLEALDLGGGLPIGIHTIGCPPHWPAPNTNEFGLENNVKTAVENALARS